MSIAVKFNHGGLIFKFLSYYFHVQPILKTNGLLVISIFYKLTKFAEIAQPTYSFINFVQ